MDYVIRAKVSKIKVVKGEGGDKGKEWVQKNKWGLDNEDIYIKYRL